MVVRGLEGRGADRGADRVGRARAGVDGVAGAGGGWGSVAVGLAATRAVSHVRQSCVFTSCRSCIRDRQPRRR